MKRKSYFIFNFLLAAALLLSTSIFAQVDYTSRVVNSSFELNDLGETHTGGVLRVIEPFGWSFNHNFAINTGVEPDVVYLGNNSQGLNNDTGNRDGNYNFWFSGQNMNLPDFVELSQTIIPEEGDYLPAGRYLVSCRMEIITDKITTQRLFANDLVQYFGAEADYDLNLTPGEINSYAGHAVSTGNPGTMKDLEVIITLDGNTPLKIGVRTNSVLKDGSPSAADTNPIYGWFKLDYFRLIKLSDTEIDATLSDLQVNGNTVANFDPFVEEYTVILPAGSASVITATPTQEEASHQVVDNTVIVTSSNGEVDKTYTINFIYSLTTDWNGGGITGAGSEAYNFGWRTFMGGTDLGAVPYTTSGSGYMRYMDNYLTYGSGRRLLFLRWDAQASYGNLDGTAVHSYPMTLEADKTYKVTFDYAGQNDGPLTLRAGINTERNNSGTSLISETYECVYRVWNGAELIITPTESREYYLTIARESGDEIIFSFSNLITTHESGVGTTSQELAHENTVIYLNADKKVVVSTSDLATHTPLVIYNLYGQVIYQGFITGNRTVLDHSLSAGVYIVKAGNHIQKIMVP